jgi:hypothetical protein
MPVVGLWWNYNLVSVAVIVVVVVSVGFVGAVLPRFVA